MSYHNKNEQLYNSDASQINFQAYPLGAIAGGTSAGLLICIAAGIIFLVCYWRLVFSSFLCIFL